VYEEEMTIELNLIMVMEMALNKGHKTVPKEEQHKSETIIKMMEFALKIGNFKLLTCIFEVAN